MKRIMARHQAVEVRDLNEQEQAAVSGGSIVQELEERFPFGEWIGNSFFPHGAPRGGGMPSVPTLGVNEG